MKHLFAILTAALCLLIFPGCAGVDKINGKIVSVNSTCLGLDLSQSQADPVPHLRFGLIRSTYTVIPVNTNGTAVAAPNYKTGVRDQHKLWSFDINEGLASGDSNVVQSLDFNLNTNVYNTATTTIK